MSAGPAQTKNANALVIGTAFLIEMSKTLSRVQLYALNHPMVAESIVHNYATLRKLFDIEQSLEVAWTGEKLLVNGVPQTNLGMVTETFSVLFDKFHLHSITFQREITGDELGSFYRILTQKRDPPKTAEEFKGVLTSENVRNIHLDISIFAKVSSKSELTDTKSMPDAKTDSGEFLKSLETMPLESMIWQVVKSAVPNPEDQKKVYELILSQIEQNLTAQVEKATEQLKVEKQVLTNENKRTESLISHMAEGVIVVDENGRVVMTNPAAEKIYGAALANIKGKRIEELAGEELMLALSKEIAAPADTPAVQAAGNAQGIVRQSTAMIRNPEGKVVGILSILQDIAKMKEIQRMQNDFVSHVTHELRSPLTAIKFALSELSETPSISANQHHSHVIEIAARNIDRLARLINDILDFGKLESGKLEIRPVPMDIYTLLEETAKSLVSWAANKNISLEIVTMETPVKVLADKDRITQVIVNLISNAIKFTPSGGRIVLKAEAVTSYLVQVNIIDNGKGISSEDQKRLFERFFQAKQIEKSDVPGTGLGLHISKTIVELHKGQIGFESKPGKGTTFYFTLPLVKEAESPALSAAAGQTAAKKRSWLSRLLRR